MRGPRSLIDIANLSINLRSLTASLPREVMEGRNLAKFEWEATNALCFGCAPRRRKSFYRLVIENASSVGKLAELLREGFMHRNSGVH